MYKFMGNRACHWISFRKSWDINERRDWLTDWLTGDWDFGRCKNSKVDFFPLIILFPGDCILFFDPPHTSPPLPLFLMVHPLVWISTFEYFFISVKQGNCMYDRPRSNVEVELGLTIQFMCDLPLHLIYLRSYMLRA